MLLKNSLHTFFRFWGLKVERTISSFRNKLAVYSIKRNEYKINGEKIFFKLLDLEIPLVNAKPILERYQNAIQLFQKGGFIFFANDAGELYTKNKDLHFKINDEEELFILSEVFLEGAYNLITSTSKKIALVDIGMNVGITALFYASKKNVEKIYSFEPFLPTYSMALENINLNPSVAHKIKPNNFGLAKNDNNVQVPYSSKEKGRMGLKGLPKSEGYISGDVSTQAVHLKEAGNELLKIKEQLKDNYVVCKIDTEGAEYEIIDSFYNAGLLSFADVYFIEWHQIKPSDIVLKLKDNNYTIIETTFSLLHSGMIYAIKNNA